MVSIYTRRVSGMWDSSRLADVAGQKAIATALIGPEPAKAEVED
jgi:hypothetical protein